MRIQQSEDRYTREGMKLKPNYLLHRADDVPGNPYCQAGQLTVWRDKPKTTVKDAGGGLGDVRMLKTLFSEK